MDFEIPCQHAPDTTVADHFPLDRQGIRDMLALAQRHAGDAHLVSKVQVRLNQAIPGMECPRPVDTAVAERAARLDALFVERYQEGAAPDLVDRLARIVGI